MSSAQKLLMVCLVLLLGVAVYSLSPILMPFLIGSLLAYLGNPLVNRLVKWHLPRTLAVTLVFVFIIVAVVSALVALVPLLEDQIFLFIAKIPTFMNWVQSIVVPWFETRTGIDIASIDVGALTSSLTPDWQQTGHIAMRLFKTITHSGALLFAVGLNIVLIPVVTFYLLRDWVVLMDKSKKLIPRKYVKTMSDLFSECDEVLSAFFRGQFLVMLALGIFYSVALGVIGLDLALLVGVLIAVLSIVPYLGSIVGLAICLVATVFQFSDTSHLVYVTLIFIAGHVLESLILAPLLIGNRIGLHPVAVIFAILAGGELFGFLGILLALPVAAVVMVWVRYVFSHYTNSRFYQR